MQDGEDFEAAARREAHEELGLAQVQLTQLWEDSVWYEAHGRQVHQLERFFLARCDVAPGELVSHRAEHELEGISAVRWWGLDELRRTPERVFPENLLERLEPLLGR